MVDLAIFLQEDAIAGDITCIPLLARVLHLLLGSEVEHHGLDGVVNGGMEVVVEVGAAARVPRPLPTVLLLEGLEFLDWSAGDAHEVRILEAQVIDVRETLTYVAATTTTLVIARLEHEVIDDELVIALKQVAKSNGSIIRALERVCLVHLDHGQLAPLLIDGVIGDGELLLHVQELLPRGEPLITTNDLVGLLEAITKVRKSRGRLTFAAAISMNFC